MISAIIVANGNSHRFGKTDKLKTLIAGTSIIERSIQPFIDNSDVTQIIVVCQIGVESFLKERIKTDALQFCRGGDTRTKSVAAGIKLVTNSKVLIHDGARPFLSSSLLQNIITTLKNNEAVVPVLPITSALKKIVANKMISVKREEYVITQTPQGFDTSLIKKAFVNVDDFFYDEAEMIEQRTTATIKRIPGENANIKITTVEDLS